MLIFTHVPKTAGSTINRAVTDLLGAEALIVKSSAEVGLSTEGVRFIGGHVRHREMRERFPEAKFIVSIRHPLHRVLSHYFMMLRNNPSASAELGPDRPGKAFRAFYKHWIARKKWGNLQCQYICGESSAALAIAAIQEQYCIAWISERTSLAWPMVYALLTGDEPCNSPKIRKQMVGTNTPAQYGGFLDVESLQMLTEDNAEDMQLYEWIVSERGIWESHSSATAPSPPDAVR